MPIFKFKPSLPTHPIPCFGTDPSGSPRDVDNVAYFDLAGAAERSGIGEADLRQLWLAFRKEIVGDEVEDDADAVVIDAATGDKSEVDVEAMSDAEIRELAARQMRGDFTRAEWAAFVAHATAMGYDVAKRECYPKRITNPDSNKPEIVCLAKIEALESRVLASGLYDGMVGPLFADADGVAWREAWTGPVPPAFCKIELFRKGVTRGHVVIVAYDEFVKFEDDDATPNRWYKVKYCVSLSRNARAKGFREFFRDVVGNVYVAEEFPDAASSRRRGATSREAIGAASVPGPKAVAYAPDAEVGTGEGDAIFSESNCRSAMTHLGVPESAQARLIANARSTNPLGEDDSPDAFWIAVVGEAQKLVGGGRRRSR